MIYALPLQTCQAKDTGHSLQSLYRQALDLIQVSLPKNFLGCYVTTNTDVQQYLESMKNKKMH
jgi:hypothetical protein